MVTVARLQTPPTDNWLSTFSSVVSSLFALSAFMSQLAMVVCIGNRSLSRCSRLMGCFCEGSGFRVVVASLSACADVKD